MKLNTSNLFAVVVSSGIILGGVVAVDSASAGKLAEQRRISTGAGNLAEERRATAGASNLAEQQRTTSGAGHSTTGGYSIPFAATCAPGFFKAGEKKQNHEPKLKWYVCSTPVLVCPKQLQANGKYSAVKVTAVVQPVGGDPDSGDAKWRLQYKCEYTYNAWPEG